MKSIEIEKMMMNLKPLKKDCNTDMLDKNKKYIFYTFQII